jgi:hypothetical protein
MPDPEVFVTITRAAILLVATLIGCAPATQEQPDSIPGFGGNVTVPDALPSITGTVIIDGRIARLDVRQQGTVKTAEGAGIGDTEERIHALYPGRVEVQPHKYVDGHYLIVTPEAPADSQYRMIFETDGRRVTSYRTGRLPEVRWIEGCS